MTAAGNFGARLKLCRKQQDFTLRELAGKTGVSLSTISRIESGTGEIYLSSAARLANALSMSLETMVQPPKCDSCYDMGPAGFTCNACGVLYIREEYAGE